MESSETKKCGECLAEIPKEAKKCSHCGSVQQQVTPKQIAIGFLVLFLFITFIIVISGGDSSSTSTDKMLSIGEDGIINNNTDCSGATSVGTTKENYSALIDAISADDRLGYAGMLGDGRAYLVDNCTKVKKIGGSFTMAEIRILEGKYLGESGWTAVEFVLPTAE